MIVVEFDDLEANGTEEEEEDDDEPSTFLSKPKPPPMPESLAISHSARLQLMVRSQFSTPMPNYSAFLDRMQKIMDDYFDVPVKLHFFGSTVTTLGLPSSDIDLCGIIQSDPGPFRKSPQNMRYVADILRKHGYKNIRAITHARVPICTFFDPYLNVWCDFNTSNQLGVMNSRLLRAYVDTSPYVRPLILLIKTWANKRGLNDSASGGMFLIIING